MRCAQATILSTHQAAPVELSTSLERIPLQLWPAGLLAPQLAQRVEVKPGCKRDQKTWYQHQRISCRRVEDEASRFHRTTTRGE
jgi:hypothetical protein